MLLLEAMLLGRPVVSVQPGLSRENMFRAGHRGYARILTDPVEGESLLAQLIQSGSFRQETVARHQPFVDSVAKDSLSPLMSWITSKLQSPRTAWRNQALSKHPGS